MPNPFTPSFGVSPPLSPTAVKAVYEMAGRDTTWRPR